MMEAIPLPCVRASIPLGRVNSTLNALARAGWEVIESHVAGFNGVLVVVAIGTASEDPPEIENLEMLQSFATYVDRPDPTDSRIRIINGIEVSIDPIECMHARFMVFRREARTLGWNGITRRAFHFLPKRTPLGRWWVFFASPTSSLPQGVTLDGTR